MILLTKKPIRSYHTSESTQGIVLAYNDEEEESKKKKVIPDYIEDLFSRAKDTYQNSPLQLDVPSRGVSIRRGNWEVNVGLRHTQQQPSPPVKGGQPETHRGVFVKVKRSF